MANQNGMTKRKKAPVSSHPQFPAVVALWFAALFGLGSLAIRATLLEGAVLAAGLDQFVPAAAPPLGATARILFALSLAVLGGLLGALIARAIAGPSARKPAPEAEPDVESESAPLGFRLRSRDSHPDAPPRRPILALDEFGDDIIGVPAPGPNLLPDLSTSEPADCAEAAEPAEADFIEAATPAETAAERIAGASLERLGMVELTERLGLALQRRRAADSAAIAAALEPAHDEPELPLHEDESQAFDEDRGYSSLLGLTRRAPPAAEPAEPVVVFPSQAARQQAAPANDPAETERALRAALAALQRMSGAA